MSELNNKVKRMDLEEFRNKGFLQEVNRQFFHPLGLALEIIIDTDTNKVLTLGGIWDYRDDPEGMLYENDKLDPEKIKNIKELKESKLVTRMNLKDYTVNGMGVQEIHMIDFEVFVNNKKSQNVRVEYNITEEQIKEWISNMSFEEGEDNVTYIKTDMDKRTINISTK